MKTLLVLLSFILSLSCNEKKNEPNESNNQSLQIDDYLIVEGRAGTFVLEADIDKITGYKLIKTAEIAEEDSETPIYNVVDEGIVLCPRYNYDTERFTNLIGEIRVESSVYKTQKGIKVGSTVEDFMTAYTDATLGYSYISGYFWIESPSLSRVQFILDENGFTNKDKDLMSGDYVELKSADFKKSTIIENIRIF